MKTKFIYVVLMALFLGSQVYSDIREVSERTS